MARTVVSIWNGALRRIGGRGNIQSLTESTSEAQICAAIWEDTRDAALEGFDWNFLTAYRALSALSEDPPDSWDYVYQYPSDCLRFRYIEGESRTDDPLQFEIGNGTGGTRVIFSDEESAIGCYSKKINEPTLWSAAFCTALQWEMAIILSSTQIGSPADPLKLMAVAERMWTRAKVQSANEEQPDARRDSDGIMERE